MAKTSSPQTIQVDSSALSERCRFVGKLFRGAVQRAMLDLPKLLGRFMAQRAVRVAAAA